MGSWKTDKFSWCSLLSFAPKGIFIVIKKNSPSRAAALLEQISGTGEEYRNYLLLFAEFEQVSFTHLYSLHVMGTNGGQISSELPFVLAQARGKKKKLHLIEVLSTGVEVVYDCLSDDVPIQEKW